MLRAPASWSRRGVDELALHARLMRGLAAILRSGGPVPAGLRAAAAAIGEGRRRGRVEELAEWVERGSTLGEGLARVGGFDPGAIAVVRASEGGRALPEMVDDLGRHYETELELAATVRAGATYPSLILAALLAELVLLMTVIASGFRPLLAGDGAPSSAPLWLDTADAPVALVAIALAVLVLGSLFLLRLAPAHRLWSRIVLRVPVVGPLAASSLRAMICRVLASQIGAGSRLDEAFHAVARMFPHHCVSDELERKARAIAGGLGAGDMVRSGDVLDRFTSKLVDLAWGSARLPTTFERIAAADERQVRDFLASALPFIETALVAMLGGVVALAICGQASLYFQSLGQGFPF